MHAAVDQQEHAAQLWQAANSLQLRPAGPSAHDVTAPTWPGGAYTGDIGDPNNGSLSGTHGRWMPSFQRTPRHSAAPVEPPSPPLIAPVPVRPKGAVLGSGSSAFRPTAAALQNQRHAQQALHMLQLRAPCAVSDATVPAVHRYDCGVPDFSGTQRQSSGAYSPPKCHMSLAHEKAAQQHSKQQFNITASAVAPRDPLNGLLQAVSFMGMHEGQVGQASPFMHFHGGHEPAQQAIASQPPLLQRNVAAAYTSFLNPHSSGELSPVPNSPPTTPPRSAQKTRTACQRSPTKTPLRVQGGVGKPKSPTLQERLLHSQRGARSNASSTATGSTNSSPATSGHSNGTVDGCGANVGSGACSHTGTWTEEDKAALLAIVQEVKPCGAVEWEAVANRLGRWSRGGASAERMFRTLADPQYHKSSNRHGCRLNPRTGTAMHVMVEYALQRLPGNEGNIDAIAKVIEANPEFARQLDYSARPGTKTYPRWKDTLLGCFKAGRYRHLLNTKEKINGKNVYRLVAPPTAA